MSFDPYNCPLKVWESIGTPTPKMGAHLGVWGFIPSHPLTFLGAWNVTPGLMLGLHLASRCFGHKPKARVATWIHAIIFIIHKWKKCDRVWIIWGQKVELFIMIVRVHVKLFVKNLIWKRWMNVVVLPQLCIKVLQTFGNLVCPKDLIWKVVQKWLFDGDMWITWSIFKATFCPSTLRSMKWLYSEVHMLLVKKKNVSVFIDVKLCL